MRKANFCAAMIGACLIVASTSGCASSGASMPRATKDRVTVSTNCYWLPGATVPTRVAVLDFEGWRYDGRMAGGQALTDMMVMTLLDRGFTVLERDHLQDVLYELQIAEEGFQSLSDVQKAQKLGRVLNAEVILTGKVLKMQTMPAGKAPGGSKNADKLSFVANSIELSARAIDVATGEIIWMSTISATAESKSGEVLRYMDFIEEACEELVYSLRNPEYQNRQNAIFEGKSEIAALRKQREI